LSTETEYIAAEATTLSLVWLAITAAELRIKLATRKPEVRIDGKPNVLANRDALS
jgi:hypothetical protein